MTDLITQLLYMASVDAMLAGDYDTQPALWAAHCKLTAAVYGGES